MTTRRWPLLLALAAVACSGGDESAPTTTAAPATTTTAATTTTVPGPEEPLREFADGPLAEVCPPTIVVQLDDVPAIRSGPLFDLLDVESVAFDEGRTSAPIRRSDGTLEAVRLEIRTGGPAVSFRSALDLLGADASIHLADAPFSALAAEEAAPATGVVALTAGSDEMIMWDPAARPGIEGLDTLGSSGIDVLTVEGEPFVEFLVANGVLAADQLVPGPESGIAAFVTAEGAVARQGDATTDPVLFPRLEGWGRPVDFALASDGGWRDLGSVLATEGERLAPDCLGRLVPIVQDAIRGYAADPSDANRLVAAARAAFNPLDRLAAEVLDEAAAFAASPDAPFDTFTDETGGFDVERLDRFAADLAASLGVELRPVEDVIDGRFLDPDR